MYKKKVNLWIAERELSTVYTQLCIAYISEFSPVFHTIHTLYYYDFYFFNLLQLKN